MSLDTKYVFTILGSSGGLAKSVLSILNKTATDQNDPLHACIHHANFHLIDQRQKELSYFQKVCPNLVDQLTFHEFNLFDTKKFSDHLKQTKTSLVIDLSFADTVEMLECCNELEVLYVNSALENRMVDEDENYEGFTLIERYKIYEGNKPRFTNTTAIVCSGMNPGVVQWMVLELMKREQGRIPLGCYIVEEDLSFFADEALATKDTIYSSWSPECFLDEAILNYPMFVREHQPLFLYNKVYEQEYKVSLGDKEFYGCLMPHEEVLTLGALYDMELGFIYKVNQHTTQLIRRHLENVDVLWNHDMRVLNPEEAELAGEDLVGVLLVYEDHEHFMYNVLSNKEIFQNFKTNATYFQVACGIYAATATLLLDSIPKGVYYVDELLLNTSNRYGQYVKYYMTDFTIGRNERTDGLLVNRRQIIKENPQ